MTGLATPTDPARVRALNDALRRSFTGGRVMLTAGVASLAADTRAAVFAAVRAFGAFEAGNDPHAEDDFGAVTVGGVTAFWKIDCYDRSLTAASPDPADPTVTTRVLTIMLPEEY